jgi:hypothetical protein
MALGPNSLVFLQRTTPGRLNPLVRSERPPDTRSGRQSTIIPAVFRETTPGGLDTLLKTRYTDEFHAAFGGCGPRDAHLAASPGDRGRSITPRSLQRFLETDEYDVTVRRMRPQALSCFATLPRLQSSWSFIEGLVVRDGMSSEYQERRPRDPNHCIGHLVEVRDNVLAENETFRHRSSVPRSTTVMHKFWRSAAECLVASLALTLLTVIFYRLHLMIAEGRRA